jgi:hypothetical protein
MRHSASLRVLPLIHAACLLGACAIGAVAEDFNASAEAAPSIGIGPEDLLDRIIESARNDALLILADEWSEVFGDKGVLRAFLPATSGFIASFKLEAKPTTFAHIRNAIRKDVFEVHKRFHDYIAYSAAKGSVADFKAYFGLEASDDAFDPEIREVIAIVAEARRHQDFINALLAVWTVIHDRPEKTRTAKRLEDIRTWDELNGNLDAIIRPFRQAVKRSETASRADAAKVRELIGVLTVVRDKAVDLLTPDPAHAADDEALLVKGVFDSAICMLGKDYLGFSTEVLLIVEVLERRRAGTMVDKEASAGKYVKMLHHMTVFATIAAAKTTDDAKAAMDAIVAKPGTYREIRHKVGPYLLLDAYLGAAIGKEYVRETDVPRRTYYAPFVPVGIEGRYTWSSRCEHLPSGIGLMIAPIDLGNIAARRYRSDGTQRETEWKDVWAPGAFLTIPGGYKFPVTLGGGVQYAPGMRVDPATGAERDALRWTVFLAWEVPLFTF